MFTPRRWEHGLFHVELLLLFGHIEVELYFRSRYNHICQFNLVGIELHLQLIVFVSEAAFSGEEMVTVTV